MRDPARIDRILTRLRVYWTANPDLRLAQIVVNAANPGDPAPQVFYVEDARIEDGIPNLAASAGTSIPICHPRACGCPDCFSGAGSWCLVDAPEIGPNFLKPSELPHLKRTKAARAELHALLLTLGIGT